MKIEELLKKGYDECRPAVSEQEWERISHDPRVLRHNRIRRWRKAWIGGGIGLVTVAVITTALILLHSHPTDTYQSDKQNNSKESTTQIEIKGSCENATVAATEQPLMMEKNSPQNAPAASATIAEESATVATNATPTAQHNPQSPINTTTAAPVKAATKPATAAVARPSAPKPAQTTKATAGKGTQSQETPNHNETNEQPAQNPQFASKLFIPSAFTPNGDGLNDQFFVTANYEPATFEITIFTRTNEKVFHARSMEIGWDGTRYGAALPQGVYLYLIKYTNADGKQEAQRGQVLLLK